MATHSKSKILVVDDYPLIRESLEKLINQQPDLHVCGLAHNQTTAVRQVTALRPDLVLLDISLSDCNGLNVLKTLKSLCPEICVLVFSMHDERLYAVRAVRAGASGYLMKHESTDTLLTAIREVLQGEVHLSKTMESRVLNQMLGKKVTELNSPVELLSDRELDVFTGIGHGFSSREIAQQLHVSVKTVESHRTRIREKLQLKSSVELVQQAIEHQKIQLA